MGGGHRFFINPRGGLQIFLYSEGGSQIFIRSSQLFCNPPTSYKCNFPYSPRALRDVSTAIATPVTIIFRTSLRTKELPNDWKHANVSAVFKNKGEKTSPVNYRPVSLTCILCKVMESIIRDSLIDHMKKNNLFSSQQFGFINGRSTILQLMHVIDIWTQIIDEGGNIDAV